MQSGRRRLLPLEFPMTGILSGVFRRLLNVNGLPSAFHIYSPVIALEWLECLSGLQPSGLEERCLPAYSLTFT